MDYISVVQFCRKIWHQRAYCTQLLCRRENRRSIPNREDMEYSLRSVSALQSQAEAKPFAEPIERRERGKVERRHLSSHTDWLNLQFQSHWRQSSHKKQTRYIFETNTLGINENTSVDDIIETVNHFRCIDYVIDHATEKISERHIKQLHSILKANTSDSRKSWFATGNYELLPNEVGGEETTKPKEVHSRMKTLIDKYNDRKWLILMIFWTFMSFLREYTLFKTAMVA